MAFVYVSNAVSGDGFHKLYDWHGWNTTASKNAKGFLPSPPTLNLWLVRVQEQIGDLRPIVISF